MARDETGTITLDSWVTKPEWMGRQGADQEILSLKKIKDRKVEEKVERGEVPRMRRSSLYQTLKFMKDPVGLLAEAQQQCGDIFCLRLVGMGDWVFLCSPDLIRELYQVPETQLAAGAANKDFMGEMLGEDALFCLDGQAHLQRRRLLFPLLSGVGALAHTERVGDLVNRLYDRWSTDEPIALLPLLENLNLQAFFLAAFGEIEPERLERIADLASDYFEKGLRSPLVMMRAFRWNLGPKSPWGRIVAMHQSLQGALEQEIEYRRTNPPASAMGIIDELLAPKSGAEERLSTRALVHELCTLGAAANESMPKLLTWTIIGILSNPMVVSRIRDELNQVVGDGPLRAEHIGQLEYLEAVMYEGMRFQPATDTAGVRRALQPTQLGGYTVPKGAVVTQCLSAIAKRPELFAQVDQFEPEHFLHTGLKAHHWKPFGGGRRTCTGKGFALMGMKLVVANLFRRFDLELGPAGNEAVRKGFFRIPRGGGEVILKPRKQGAEVSADMSSAVADMSRSPAAGEDREEKSVKTSTARCPFAFLHRS